MSRLLDDYNVYAVDLPEIDYDNMMSEVLLQYMKLKGLSQVYLMGHSFGAFHALNFADNLIFAWGMPAYQLRCLGWFGLHLFTSLLYFTNNLSTKLKYWYQVQACQHSIGDFIVRKYFHMTHSSCTWNRPAWRKFMSLSMPVALCYGEVDDICPPIQ
eukprot:gene33422-41239_t